MRSGQMPLSLAGIMSPVKPVNNGERVIKIPHLGLPILELKWLCSSPRSPRDWQELGLVNGHWKGALMSPQGLDQDEVLLICGYKHLRGVCN